MPGLGLEVATRDDISPALERVAAGFTRDDVRRVMGRAVVNVLKDHFVRLDADRHRSEGPHFYGQVGRSVQQPNIESDGFTVAINQVGIAQRYFGGTITAGANGSGAKFLTIPAVPAAMGRRAGEFSHLKFVFFRGLDLGALVSQDPSRVVLRGAPRAKKEQGRRLVPREDGRPQVIFWLKRSVTQKADPSVLPTGETMSNAAFTAADSYLQREAARGGPGNL